jgi:hypothetical protein
MLHFPKEPKPGMLLTAEWMRKLWRAVRRSQIRLGVNSGLAMIQNDDVGTLLWVTKNSGGAQLALTASGGITAAVDNAGSCTNSGTLVKSTPGTGSVYPMAYDGTCLVADTSVTAISVLSFSTTTGGIPANVKVWITQNDNDGQFYVTSVDCGN